MYCCFVGRYFGPMQSFNVRTASYSQGSNHFAKKIIYTINNSNFPNRLQIILLHKHRIRLHESRFVLFIYLLFIVYLGYKYKKITETQLIKTC
jgi:hypothetical protein